MAEAEAQGWVKLHRRIRRSPVWRHATGYKLFTWMLLEASHCRRSVKARGGAVELARGQLAATLGEMAAEAGMSEKQVRTALAFLERERMINRDGRAGVVTVMNYPIYQGDDDEPAPGEEGEGKKCGVDEGGQAKGQQKGQQKGQAKTPKQGREKTGENALRGNGFKRTSDGVRAGGNGDGGQVKGQQKGQAKGQSQYMVVRIDHKNINPPNPPFAKGGRASFANSDQDDERYSEVLGIWREERERAGLAFLEDRNTAQGAAKLADEYLAMARLSTKQLRLGMRKLCEAVVSDPRKRDYDLRTLARNPSKWCPPVVIEKKKRRLVLWGGKCDVCGRSASLGPFAPESDPAPPLQPCPGAESGCQGWMTPEIWDERLV